jgi:hypothetical protein
MKKHNLYDDEVYDTIVDRIHKLRQENIPKWGKMNAAQMMAHCSEVVEVYNGKKELQTSFFSRLFKGYIKKIVVGPKPYKKNAPTAPQFKITSEQDFYPEKARLLEVIDVFYHMEKDEAEQMEHPLFGKMTLEERGWAIYKHLDHHLRQFGV